MDNAKRPRLTREKDTVAAMIALYCRNQHSGSEICPECATLRDYAVQRLDKCPFGEEKTTCAKCAVHCYKPEMRERIQAVMRYSGTRMMYKHPLQAVRHLIDARRKGTGKS